ncbi:homeobox domain-containing protein, partial [Dichotomocladium elegans]
RKRTRATAEQLAVLEDTFAVNISPNAKLRKQLSERLLMSERSIQIWFQNRRAKVKHMQKRAQLQMHQAAIPPVLPVPHSPGYSTMMRAQSADAIHHSDNLFILSATTLVVGTWQRLALNATDLMCTFSQNAFQWHICDGGLQFKIHIPVESLRAIEYSPDRDEVHIDLLEAPLFYMLTDKVWTQCSDFSENRQASTYLRHTIKGAAESL